MVWATDGDNKPKPEADAFQIKIWVVEEGSEVVIYDNSTMQIIGGGNITIHD